MKKLFATFGLALDRLKRMGEGSEATLERQPGMVPDRRAEVVRRTPRSCRRVRPNQSAWSVNATKLAGNSGATTR